MATPSLFPMFLKSTSGVIGVIYGGNIQTTVDEFVGVIVEGAISVEQADLPPLAVQPNIGVTIEGEIGIEFEVC